MFCLARKGLTFALAAFLTFQTLYFLFPSFTWQKLHECMLHVDEVHCLKLLENSPSRTHRPVQMFSLSEQEQRTLIQNYAFREEAIPSSEDCLIGVGYNTCKDVNFKSVKLFDVLKVELEQLSN